MLLLDTSADLALARLFIGRCVDFNQEHAVLAARLFNESGRRRSTLADCMIAAVALCDDAPIATANVADFERLAAAGLTIASGRAFARAAPCCESVRFWGAQRGKHRTERWLGGTASVKNPLAILALPVGSMMPAPDIESVLSSRPRGFCTAMALEFEAVVLAFQAHGGPRVLADDKDVICLTRLNGTPPKAASAVSALEPIVQDLHHRFQPCGFGHTKEAETTTENAYFPLTPSLRQAQPPRISALQ